MSEQEILDAQFASVFGPAATHSEYARGDVIRYRYIEEVRRGKIIWISAPQEVMPGQHSPLSYIVDAGLGIPDPVSSSEILESLPFPCD